MDDLLREFLTETGESLDLVDLELVRFEQEPNNIKILENIFRLVHTIKGTCGFLGLPQLEALTHAAETVMSGFRGGRPVTTDAVSLILATIDRIKALLDELEAHQAEPQGNDRDLIAQLQGAATGDVAAAGPAEAAASARSMTSALAPSPASQASEQLVRSGATASSTAAGDVRDDETEHEPPERGGASPTSAASTSVTPAAHSDPIGTAEDRADGKVASSSIRLHVNTLDHLMTMVSELVLTRNQLIEIVRRHQDSRVQGSSAAALACHGRAAGRRAEDADAADRKCLAETAADRARSVGRARNRSILR